MDAISDRPSDTRLRWGLPRLGNRALLAYRVIWTMLLFVAIAANIAGPFGNARMRATTQQPFSDLGLRQIDGRKLQVPHRPALEKAGVVAGSEIVAIGGVAVPEDASIEEVGARLKAQPSPARVTIRSPDGRVREFRLERNPHWIDYSYVGTGLTPMSRVAIDLAIAGLTNVLLITASVLLFWRRPREGLAALLAVSTMTYAATENLTFYAWYLTGWWHEVSYVSSAALVTMILGLLLSPDGRFQPSWARWVAAALVLTAIFTFMDQLLGIPTWTVYLPFILSVLGVFVAMRARFRATPPGSEAWQQQRWLLLGMAGSALGMFGSFLSNTMAAFAPLSRQQLVWTYICGGISISLITLFLVAGMLIALLRYRLYDSDAALSRSAGIAIVGLIFAALFAGFAKAIEIGMDSAFGSSNGAVPGIAAAVLAAVMVTPVQNRIQLWADSRFRKALDHLRRDLPACVDDLRETASVAEIEAEILERVTTGVRATAAAIEVDGAIVASRGSIPEEWPLRLPLQVEHRRDGLEGWLLVGNRPDGSLPGRDEREALRDVLDSVSRAIRIARTREAREERQTAVIQALAARMQRLEERLA